MNNVKFKVCKFISGTFWLKAGDINVADVDILAGAYGSESTGSQGCWCLHNEMTVKFKLARQEHSPSQNFCQTSTL